MFAVRVAARAAPRAVVTRTATRNAQSVPRFGSEAEMEAEAIAQIKARIAHQKDIQKGLHRSESDEMNEMWKWVKISLLVATPLCVFSSVKDIVIGEHEDHGPELEPEYMAIRTKAFPWECEDCGLFDKRCWKKCRAEKAGVELEDDGHGH